MILRCDLAPYLRRIKDCSERIAMIMYPYEKHMWWAWLLFRNQDVDGRELQEAYADMRDAQEELYQFLVTFDALGRGSR